MTKIFEAIDRGDHGLVWQLVQSKQDLQAVDEVTGLTPLALAAELGRTETVRTLLEAGVNVNRGGASSPLESAVAEGHVEVIRLLLDAGADVNQKVSDGYTPLMTAAFLGDGEIARSLLEAGAQPRARNEAGESAIEIALDAGFEELSRDLRDFSRRAFEAEQRRQEEEKRRREDEERERRRAERRARIVAARASSKPSIPPRPVRPTAEPSRLPDFDQLRSPADATAAFEALFKQVDAAPVPVDPMAYEGIERFAILLRTAPVRSKRMVDFGEITGEELTEKGETPLMLAAMAGEAAVVRTLLDRGVEVDQADTSENQETALLKAAQSPSRGRQETIDALLDAGADLERRHGPAGRTPLMFAAQADVYNPDPHARIFGDTTRHLVKRGARLAAEDAAGDTLLKSIKRAALGAPTTSPFRRRLFDMLKVIEGLSGFTGDS